MSSTMTSTAYDSLATDDLVEDKPPQHRQTKKPTNEFNRYAAKYVYSQYSRDHLSSRHPISPQSTKTQADTPKPADPLGFQKWYNFIFFFIFAQALFYFCWYNIRKIDVQGYWIKHASPSEQYYFTRSRYGIGMQMHLGCKFRWMMGLVVDGERKPTDRLIMKCRRYPPRRHPSFAAVPSHHPAQADLVPPHQRLALRPPLDGNVPTHPHHSIPLRHAPT